jgi:RNA polymerase sigma factor (sigma-70 family)
MLGDTIVEAEEVYAEYAGLLNSIAYTYHVSTGVEKSDLFAEALIGLARAKQDFDSKRSEEFQPYAIFRVKDALNEYIRKYAKSISIPSYLRKASWLFEKLRRILEASADMNTMLDILEYGETVDTIPPEICNACEEILEKLNNYANRASITYEELILRIQLLPNEVSIDLVEEPSETEETEDTILVKQMMDRMTEEERFICECIMADMSYTEIGNKIGKSKGWVAQKVKHLGRRFEND